MVCHSSRVCQFSNQYSSGQNEGKSFPRSSPEIRLAQSGTYWLSVDRLSRYWDILATLSIIEQIGIMRLGHGKDHPCGTVGRYRKGCNCSQCKAAYRQYLAEIKAKKSGKDASDHRFKPAVIEEYVCSQCNRKFFRNKSEVERAHRRGQSGPYCSRSCATKRKHNWNDAFRWTLSLCFMWEIFSTGNIYSK